MNPFTPDQVEYIQDQISNRAIGIAAHLKRGRGCPAMAAMMATEIESICRDLPRASEACIPTAKGVIEAREKEIRGLKNIIALLKEQLQEARRGAKIP